MNLFGELDPKLHQWLTPAWAAEELVDRYFGYLTSSDLVLEPSAGRGAFLQAIPNHVPALGVEIDPVLAAQCRVNTGRRVICGDFTTCDLPPGITAIVGNPPFSVDLIWRFLGRSAVLLPELGKCGMILPAYAMQTHGKVLSLLHHWSLAVDLLPRRLFPRLRLPLVFVTFTRGSSRSMIGMALYAEAVDVDNLSKRTRALLIEGRPRKGVWRAVVEDVLAELGEATLPAIYEAIEPRRPTGNQWWREKVRQQLQQFAVSTEKGVWRMA